MPDVHVVTFTEPHPDRDRGCWASDDNLTACNQPATTDVGLCRHHHDVLSAGRPVPEPAVSAEGRVVYRDFPGVAFSTDVDSDGAPWLPADVWEAARTSGSR